MVSTMLIRLLVCFAFFNFSTASCPQGTTSYGYKCYAWLGMDFSRNTSLNVCQETYGPYARLVTPATANENQFVLNQAEYQHKTYTWLAFIANGEYYVGDNGHPPAFTKFAPGQPSSVALGNCVVMDLGGYWYSKPCGEFHSGLCEMDLNPITTTQKPTLAPVTSQPIGFPSCVKKYLNFVPCPSGWEYYPPTCACFKIISDTTYYNAMNTCRWVGGTLASVHTWGEAAFIQRLAAEVGSSWVSTASGRDNIIVGLTYNTSSQTFQWDDSSYFDFPQGFAPGEPSSYQSQGQIILKNPMGYATYIRMADCSTQTCRYAACKRYVN